MIVFNHGYIRPTDYRTTERYGGYVDAIALRGYIVFKPDYAVTVIQKGVRLSEVGTARQATQTMS